MNTFVEASPIPFIPPTKNYWLVRTQSGRYYREFRDRGFIGINWEAITIEQIQESTHTQLTNLIRTAYPEKIGAGRTAAQLRTFVRGIKKGDTVVITGPASNKFSIGIVDEDEPFFKEVSEAALEVNSKLCPYQKRKRVTWIKELHKWEMEMKFFKLLQHAQNTISDANDYKDLIEGLVHDFFVRGDRAFLALEVKKEGKIPMPSFFLLGKEIIDLAHEFNEFSPVYKIDVDSIDTQININSPGKMKFAGYVASIALLGLLFVGISGGKYKVTFPIVGGGFEVEMPGVATVVTEFLEQKYAHDQKEMILKTYMSELEIKTPDELKGLLAEYDTTVSSNTYDEVQVLDNKHLENPDNSSSENQ